MIKGRSEKAIMNDANVRVSALPDTLAWRNNTGTAYQGERMKLSPGMTVRVEPNMVILRDARFITYGTPGSGDLLGVTRGVGWALEGKTLTGAQQETQRKWQRAFERAGGVYGLFRSPEEAERIIVERILQRGEG